MFCHDLLPPLLRSLLSVLQGDERVAQVCALALTRDQGGLWRKKVLCKAGNGVDIYAHTGVRLIASKLNSRLPASILVGIDAVLTEIAAGSGRLRSGELPVERTRRRYIYRLAATRFELHAAHWSIYGLWRA